MKTINLLLIACFTIALASCQTNNNKPKQEVTSDFLKDNPNLKTAYFASGCFWCVEAIYESLNGVEESLSGYSGGHTKNPTYDDSNTGKTGHAEAVEIIYDPKIISFKQLVDVYFGSQNPTQVNGQGPDNGSQYRSIIFYSNDFNSIRILSKIKGIFHKLIKGCSCMLNAIRYWKILGICPF